MDHWRLAQPFNKGEEKTAISVEICSQRRTHDVLNLATGLVLLKVRFRRVQNECGII